MAAVACGTEATTIGTRATGGDGEMDRLSGCEDGAQAIADLLGSGLPMYDYDAADDLDELVAASDLVVSGTLRSVVRVAGQLDESELEPIKSQFTKVEADHWQVLSTVDGSGAGMPRIFVMDSFWPQGGEDDPLSAEIDFETDGVGSAALRFVAFLHDNGDQPAPVVGVQGLVIGCGDDLPFQ